MMRTLKFVSWNTLFDGYINPAWYRHVRNKELLEPGARLPYILDVIKRLEADVIGLQEADAPLAHALNATGEWQPALWTKKTHPRNDGCILLVRPGLTVEHKGAYHFGDGSGHLMQWLVVEGITVVNTHLKWANPDENPRVGVQQAAALITQIGSTDRVVLLADCNYRPGELPREMIISAGFVNPHRNRPTAFVKDLWTSIDLAAVRGLKATPCELLTPSDIPRADCPSDHVPVGINVTLPA